MGPLRLDIYKQIETSAIRGEDRWWNSAELPPYQLRMNFWTWQELRCEEGSTTSYINGEAKAENLPVKLDQELENSQIILEKMP